MNQKTALKQLRLLGKNQKKMRLAAESWNSHFQILISTILSARTMDEVTIPIAEKLFRKYPNSKALSKAKFLDIKKIIKPVNFYKNKSKNIIECSKQIEFDFNGKIPREIDELIKLKGVGRKTANVFLSETGDKAIGVDTHLGYVSRKLGWSNHVNPHKIEIDLKNLFPKRYWSKVNPIAVRFGKTHTSRKEKDKLLEEIKRIR